MSNWEKVTQDKELLSKVEDWVRGLSIDSPQEIFDEMNRLTGNDWSREQYESHIFDYPDFYDMEEVVYALFHEGKYPMRTREDIFAWNIEQAVEDDKAVCTFFIRGAYKKNKEKSNLYTSVDVKGLYQELLGAFPEWNEDADSYENLFCLKNQEVYGFEKSIYIQNVYDRKFLSCTLTNMNQEEKDTFVNVVRKYCNHVGRGAYESLCEELGTEDEIEMGLDDVLAKGPSGSTLTITLEDGEINIQGTINLGYIGTFANEEIEIDDTLEEIREWEIVQEHLDEDCTDEELIAFLNKYFNEFADKITRNIDNINGTFLLQTFTDMECNEIDFMEIEELFLEDKLPYGNEEDIAELYNFARDGLRSLVPYLESPNDGCIPKGHIEALLRSFFPAFDFDCFIDNIVPEVVTLCDGSIAFQCSDAFDEAILCGAYAELDEELSFKDWHNF